jgi:hypothetical protein
VRGKRRKERRKDGGQVAVLHEALRHLRWTIEKSEWEGRGRGVDGRRGGEEGGAR